jgi:DNA-binding transcriptional ArsR family regulator
VKEIDPKQRFDDLEAVFSAFAHGTRRQILLTIHFRGGEMSAGDIAARFGHTWATTSGHLRILETAGLVLQEKRGRERLYRLNLEKFALAEEWFSWFKKPAKERRLAKRGP